MFSKIKILFFLSNLNGGGAQRTVVNLLRYLNKNEFIPTLVLLSYNKEHAFANEIPEGVNIVNLNSRGRYAVAKIANLLKQEKPDVVFSTLPQVNIAVSLAHFFSRSNSKLFLRETNYRGTNATDTLLDQKLAKFGYHKCDRAIALSGGVAEEMNKLYGLSKNKVKVIYNPVDTDSIKRKAVTENIELEAFNTNKFKIVTCGRLAKQKNQALLLKALSMLERKKEWELSIIGEGPLKEELQAYANSLGIAEDVNFIGFHSNPFAYMKKSDLFVLPSLWEGFGHVIVESMACGTPVLSTDCPYGPREIIGDNEYGWLVPNNDPEAMALKIDYLIENHQEIKEKAGIAFERAKSFDVKVIAKSYEELFRSS